MRALTAEYGHFGFFFSSRRRHTRFKCDWSSDVCSSDLMMELGATVCIPKSPKCGECPVAGWCLARELGIAGQLPDTRKKRASVQVTLAAAVLIDPRGRTLLVRQAGGDGALFSRMWQFPALETPADATSNLAKHFTEQFGVKVAGEQIMLLKTARHTVSFRKIPL